MTEFIADDLTIEIERLLRSAMEVSIAAAFVNFQGVELLKQFILKTQKTRSYNINFLLDKDFHQHPAAREAIIKELCEIPGASVRVFSEEDRRLHMKVYIFSAGNTVSVIAGSHNPTGAGLTKNIEASLLTSNRKAIREAREYFNKYWTQAKAVTPNPDAYYRDPLFQPGQRVRNRITSQLGVILGAPMLPELRNKVWYYQVMWQSLDPSQHAESELQSVTVIQPVHGDDIEQRLVTSFDEITYLRTLLLRKLVTPIREGLFAYMSSRTDIIPYQFKPLFKMLMSDSYRILIADEVGLGKTIEAGIIFSELKARFPRFRRVLIICPTNLKTKWRDEMESRFDEYFSLLNRNDFLHTIERQESNCFGIVSYEFLGHDDIIELLREKEARWDLIILDEAHHLRNINKRNKAVSQLARRSTAVVMLSATPINLGFQDLTHLLQILLPFDYRDVDEVEFAHRLEPNRYLFEAVSLAAESPKKAFRKLEEMERRCKHAGRLTSEPSYQRVRSLLKDKIELNITEKATVQIELTNLNTLANVISRTRKEDVGIGNTRDVITYEVKFTDTERELYLQMTDLARRMATSGKGKLAKRNSLAAMMPQRQAASCLPAAMEYLRDAIQSRMMPLTEISAEFADEDDESFEHPGSIGAVLDDARRILAEYDHVRDTFSDSKYNLLHEFLQSRAVVDGRLDKVIIFTGFRKTLSYLQRRLEEDFGTGTTIEIHGDIQPLVERDSRRKQFQNPKGPSILLCTEVGSEGLDMQFANKLVNYDLPWNPQRVEQRIGRIDRHGQKADKIIVLNFTITDTIEDNVLARLIERVKVFRDTIGPLGQVIGQIVSQLREDLLNPSLTHEQRAERVQKYEQALVMKAKAEERFQQERHSLLGQDSNFTDDIRNIQQNRRYVTPEELLTVIKLFCIEIQNGAKLQSEPSDKIYTLKLDSNTRQLIKGQVYNLPNLSVEKRHRYIEKVASGSFRFTTDRAVAMDHRDVDFFTLHHPVIASIVNYWKASTALNMVTGRFKGILDTISSGSYLLYTYYCEYERPNLQPTVYLYNIAVDLTTGMPCQFGDELYYAIMAGSLRPEHHQNINIDSDLMIKSGNAVASYLTRLINETSNRLQEENELLLHKQTEALLATMEKEIAILSQRRKVVGDSRFRDEITSEIQDKKDELIQKLHSLRTEPIDIVAKPELAGIAWCIVEKGGEQE